MIYLLAQRGDTGASTLYNGHLIAKNLTVEVFASFKEEQDKIRDFVAVAEHDTDGSVKHR